MASAASVGSAGLLVPVFAPITALTLAYTGHKLAQVHWRRLMRRIFTGPGRISRILLLIFLVTNRKGLIFAWTARVFGAMFRHVLIRRGPLPHKALFHYCITRTHAPLLETDYNFHKSNSTYFADLDTSRSHLVMHLFGPGMKAVGNNATTKLVRDKEGNLVKGGFGVGLGSVFCSFKKEIAPYQGYELWSKILAWDRKWIYILTHFVVKGKVLPTSWDGGSRLGAVGKLRRAVKAKVKKATDAVGEDVAVANAVASANGVATVVNGKPTEQEPEDFQKYVIATSVSKYVFKLGRFTVHPAIIIGESGLLPDRPGDGWRGGSTETGTPEELDAVEDLGNDAGGEWDWRRTEWERRKGMTYAEHFAALDGMHTIFDGGNDGALGRFRPG